MLNELNESRVRYTSNLLLNTITNILHHGNGSVRKTPQICTYHIVKQRERQGWSRKKIVRPKTRYIFNGNTKYSPKINLHFIENRKI